MILMYVMLHTSYICSKW